MSYSYPLSVIYVESDHQPGAILGRAGGVPLAFLVKLLSIICYNKRSFNQFSIYYWPSIKFAKK